MRIDIWSDIRCPFCYIGKRKFEAALERFTHKDAVRVMWRSFELDPGLQTQTDVDVYDYFARAKGLPREQALQMFKNVTNVAKEVGLQFNLGKSVVANSFNAHRLIQLAKTKNLANEAEEELFKIHFTDGKNIDDPATLIKAGIAIGLSENEIKAMLASDAFVGEVEKDELAAREIGVRGVPFFVFNNQYAVSGAQSPDIFLQALEKAWEEFEKEKEPLITTEGEVCSTEGICN